MNTYVRIGCLAAVIGAVPVAQAGPRVEVGAFVGGHYVNPNN